MSNKGKTRRRNSYHGDDVPSETLMRHHRLGEKEREVAEEVATVQGQTRRTDLLTPTGDKIRPDDVLQIRMPRASTRRHYHVLTTAIAISKDRGLNLTTRPEDDVHSGPNYALTLEETKEVRRRHAAGEATYAQMAEEYDVSLTTIYRAIHEHVRAA